MSFRVNHETESPQAVAGDLHVTLEKVSRPALVDKDGKTTISTRVAKTKYLLFEPEGIRWQFTSYQSALEEPEYPTLLNGVAWWPLPDKPNTEGWREMTLKGHTPLLKTGAFAWAADPKGPKPEIKKVTGGGSDNRDVQVESPTPEHSGLKFSGPIGTPLVVECVISQPVASAR